MCRVFLILSSLAAASAWSLLKLDPYADLHVDHSKKHFPELDDLQNANSLANRQAAASGSASTSTPGEFDVETLTTTSSTTSTVATQTDYPGTYYRGISPDGTCGANVGYSCLGSAWGNCCSTYGYCGTTTPFCQTYCDDNFGICNFTVADTATTQKGDFTPNPTCLFTLQIPSFCATLPFSAAAATDAPTTGLTPTSCLAEAASCISEAAACSSSVAAEIYMMSAVDAGSVALCGQFAQYCNLLNYTCAALNRIWKNNGGILGSHGLVTTVGSGSVGRRTAVPVPRGGEPFVEKVMRRLRGVEERVEEFIRL